MGFVAVWGWSGWGYCPILVVVMDFMYFMGVVSFVVVSCLYWAVFECRQLWIFVLIFVISLFNLALGLSNLISHTVSIIIIFFHLYYQSFISFPNFYQPSSTHPHSSLHPPQHHTLHPSYYNSIAHIQ